MRDLNCFFFLQLNDGHEDTLIYMMIILMIEKSY